MKKIFKKISCFALILTMLISSVFNIYASELDVDKLEQDMDFLENVILFVNELYQYDIDQDEIIAALYDGFFEILDNYSVCYSQEEFESFITDISGSFGGIGVQVTTENNKIIIAAPLPGTPALKAGIKAMDEIISVDEKNVEGLTQNEVSNLIRGEIGSVIRLGIRRDNTELYFNLKREEMVVSSVESKILDNKIGYLKISDFNDNTADQVLVALNDFDKNKVKKIILDVRNNPGGSVGSVVDTLNFFVPKGPVLYIDYKATGEKVYESELEKQKYDVCVLVNQNSASASEIFAGAIQDRGVGKIIGTNTYGKGVVQSIYELKNDMAVKFTTAEYFTPNKNKVQGVGIKPDIAVENQLGKPKADLSEYPKFKKDRQPGLNAVGLDVLAAEMILQTLGYKLSTPDGILDDTTLGQIKSFQKNNNLPVSEILDFATQDALASALTLYAAPETEDTQLKKAIEIMK